MTHPDSPGFARPPRGDGRLVAGVAAGLAARWELSPWLVRGAFVVATLAYGAGALLYAALAVTMPVRGASAQRVARSAEVGRTLIVALRVAGATAGLAAIAALAAALSLFGLGVVALLLACACVVAIVVRPVMKPAPLAAAAVTLTLPAAAVALADTQIAPQFGKKVVELRGPSDVDPAGYRAGTGRLLVDLRRFSAPQHSVTTISARADLKSLVVALPRNRCFNLVVDQTLDRAWPAELLDRRRPAVMYLGSPVRSALPRERELDRAGVPPSLVAYGRPVLGRSVRWRQPTPSRTAPTLHLILTTGRSQAIVRDYPDAAKPLDDPWWPLPQAFGAPRFGIPQGVAVQDSVPNDVWVPVLLNRIVRAGERGGWRGMSLDDRVKVVMSTVFRPIGASRRLALRRFVRQELLLRDAAREVTAYRDRFVGRCITPEADRRTLVPVSQPAWSRATQKLAIRWSIVWKRWPGDHTLRAAVDRAAAPGTDPVALATARP